MGDGVFVGGIGVAVAVAVGDGDVGVGSGAGAASGGGSSGAAVGVGGMGSSLQAIAAAAMPTANRHAQRMDGRLNVLLPRLIAFGLCRIRVPYIVPCPIDVGFSQGATGDSRLRGNDVGEWE